MGGGRSGLPEIVDGEGRTSVCTETTGERFPAPSGMEESGEDSVVGGLLHKSCVFISSSRVSGHCGVDGWSN